MIHPIITKEVFQFLNQLKENNNREWFTENKKQFKVHEGEVKVFFNGLLEVLKTHDEIEKLKVFRIYRDVRFSKDKTPYKYNFSASFSRAGNHRRGGYYLHIQPEGSFIATGFWNPNKEDLFRIRKEWEQDADELKEIMTQKDLKSVWGTMIGDEVKTAPKGFDKTHKNIDLIRKKQFIFVRNFSDKEVLDESFIMEVNRSFKVIRPYFDLMSNILTTNLNGESLLD
ncbi:DUF2461 domain-containing protein [Maribacter sp. 2304DJ31-5]|uniref:DUF2461 domain-containing protein n=1 Tax=Maribacter sp. 2304DJ31-5 TaxID=3386273 RepID=UPI0039BD01B8